MGLCNNVKKKKAVYLLDQKKIKEILVTIGEKKSESKKQKVNLINETES